MEVYQTYYDFMMESMNHKYTREEIDALFEVVEEAVINRNSINWYKIEHILKPGDLYLVGFGRNADYSICFEIAGLRWKQGDEIFKALLAPRVDFNGYKTEHGDIIKIHEVNWHVPITVCEYGKIPGANWGVTKMIRPENRWYGYFKDMMQAELLEDEL